MNSNKRVDLKIIILGALGVGKTSLLHQYVHKKFYEDYRTTLGASILSKLVVVDNTPLKMQIWDTGGQERFRSMVSTFYKGSDGCMLAFDVTDIDSFQSLDDWREDFLQKIIPTEQDFPMVVLGNKIDLSDRQTSTKAKGGNRVAVGTFFGYHRHYIKLLSGILAHRYFGFLPTTTKRDDISLPKKVSKEVASTWCKEKDIAYFEVSAKNDINVVQAFETLARQALSRYKGIIENYLTDSIKLTPEDQPKSKCC